MRQLILVTLGLLLSLNAFGDDIYKKVFDNVNQTHLQMLLKDMTGVNPVNVGGQTFSITDRYAPLSKMKFRAYWGAYFQALGMQVQEMPYTTAHHNGEAQGHDMEAVLPGRSADSIVIIVHYDSIGQAGNETGNPGVDDDMTGMAMMMETARILAQVKNNLGHTVRFVAADYEEWAGPGLEGARVYAQYIKNLATANNFKIVAAVDDEQSGWNCERDGLCGDRSQGNVFDVFSCSSRNGRFNYKALGDALEATATQYSSLKVKRACMGENSDHYAMWEIGVPAVVFSEHSPFNNPHFDQNGGDTYEKIDQQYFFGISQVGITFAAKLVGIIL